MKKIVISLAAVAMMFGVSSAFAADGEYAGHCAQGLTMGKQVQTDCKISWQDTATHKNYCFSSEAMKADWAKDTKANIAKADAAFAKVAKTTSTETHTTETKTTH